MSAPIVRVAEPEGLMCGNEPCETVLPFRGWAWESLDGISPQDDPDGLPGTPIFMLVCAECYIKRDITTRDRTLNIIRNVLLAKLIGRLNRIRL